MVSVEKVMAIVRGELGYTEKDDASDLYNGPAGHRNFTKYWKELDDVNWFDGMVKQGGEWCNGLPSWVALKATGSKEEGRKLLCQSGPYAACCDDAVIYYKEAGRYFDKPMVGDQVFFDYDKDKGNGEDHTGFVDELGEVGFYTIEGNSHDKVCRNYYLYTDPSIAGFGRPRYDDSSISSSDKKESIVEPIRGVETHIVKEGETLSSIGYDYGISVDELVVMNGIENRDLIYVGQKLKVKKESTIETKSEQDTTDIVTGDIVRLKKGATVYGTDIEFASFVYDAELYVRQVDTNCILVSTLKKGDVTGWVAKSKVSKL